jgi:hypothetical protein
VNNEDATENNPDATENGAEENADSSPKAEPQDPGIGYTLPFYFAYRLYCIRHDKRQALPDHQRNSFNRNYLREQFEHCLEGKFDPSA